MSPERDEHVRRPPRGWQPAHVQRRHILRRQRRRAEEPSKSTYAVVIRLFNYRRVLVTLSRANTRVRNTRARRRTRRVLQALCYTHENEQDENERRRPRSRLA